MRYWNVDGFREKTVSLYVAIMRMQIPVANYMVQEAEVQANRPTTLKNKLLPLSVPGVLNEE